MNATPRPCYRVREVLVEEAPSDGDGNIYEYHVLGKHGGIVAVCPEQPDAALIVKAVNTHDRAKAAIKAVLHEYDRCTIFDANGSKFDELRAVLADLEG